MKVLVVEDEARIAQFLRKGLSEKGYTVETVGNADEALERLESSSFDLVILDLLLPGSRDGLELCRELRGRGVSTKILMLTARRTEPVDPRPFAFGGLSYDPESREVSRGERVVRLTAREGALFELLLRRRGKVVSRAEIQARVWEDAFELSTNIIDVYITALRRKIDSGERDGVIQTVRGVGYRVRPSREE